MQGVLKNANVQKDMYIKLDGIIGKQVIDVMNVLT